MLSGHVTITNALGLHARAAAQLVRLAGKFRSKIILRRPENNVMADAKSILSLLTIAASMGTELNIEVEGPDQDEAFEAVKALFESGFGEL